MAEAAPAPAKSTQQAEALVSNGAPTAGGEETPAYVAAHPGSEGHKLTNFLLHGHPTRIDATFPQDLLKQTWQQRFSMFVVKILWAINPALKLFGFIVEWTINFFILNGGLFRLILTLLLPFRWRYIVIPSSEDADYLSLVGQMDPRNTLYVNTSQYAKEHSNQADAKVFPDENVGSRATADVCVMSAKLAYENAARVQHVVENIWEMNFVGFYSCWNDYQNMDNTQAFICTDKAHDANAVVVAFRGTEPFNAYDWSTDFDFSWVKLPGLGGVHLGFLEALGLATREDPGTFSKLRDQANKYKDTHQGKHPKLFQRTESDIEKTEAVSGLPDSIIHSRGRKLAYDAITRRVALLLYKNPRAKLFITGHSLGGALAALYAIMLYYTGRTEIADRIGCVYTFGQPRVGDEDVAKYAMERLKGRFMRVVYCNDMVPRIPFDNDLFAFKHFGGCTYFNSVYDAYVLREEPNPNYFSMGRAATMHLNAVWEVFQAMILISLRYGAEFSESVISLSARVAGLVVPGISSHSTCNYVNCVRLGPSPLRVKLDHISDLAQEFQLMEDNIKDIFYAVSSEISKILFGSKTNKELNYL